MQLCSTLQVLLNLKPFGDDHNPHTPRVRVSRKRSVRKKTGRVRAADAIKKGLTMLCMCVCLCVVSTYSRVWINRV